METKTQSRPLIHFSFELNTAGSEQAVYVQFDINKAGLVQSSIEEETHSSPLTIPAFVIYIHVTLCNTADNRILSIS